MAMSRSKQAALHKIHDEIAELHQQLTVKYNYLFHHHSPNWRDAREFHLRASRYHAEFPTRARDSVV